MLSVSAKDKEWIDNASYYELLKRWRFSNLSDTIFQGSTGAYYAEVMKGHVKGKGTAYHTKISKLIGWVK